jgi:hypothetical protein
MWHYVYQFPQCDIVAVTVHPEIPWMRPADTSFLLAPTAIMGIKASVGLLKDLLLGLSLFG